MGDEIFNKLKIRWLAVIFLVTPIVLSLSLDFLQYIGKFEAEDALFDITGNILFYMVPVCWIGIICKKNKIHVRDLITQKTETKWPRLRELIGILIGLWILSSGTFGLMYTALSYIMPSYVTAILEEKMIYTSTESIFPVMANILQLLMAIIWAPIVEELVFRGVLYNRFLKKWGIKMAIIIPSCLFGMIHFDFIGACIFGIIMTLLMIRTGNLIIPITVHMLNNFIALSIAYIGYALGEKENFDALNMLRESIWIWILCLVIGGSWATHFMYKNWPRNGTGKA